MEPGEQVQYLKGWRAEVGMISPNPGMYREYEIVAPEGIKFSRVVLGTLTEVTIEQLNELSKAVEAEAKKFKLLFKPNLICFGCTSGSFIGGPGYDQEIIKKIEKASEIPATTTTTCVLELFKDMGVRKISLVGPYPKSVFNVEAEFFKAHGIETLFVKALGLVKISEYYDYYTDPYQVYCLAKEAAERAPNADCIFVTCMLSSILGVVDILEREIGKPVISSCSATLYGILKKLGIPDPIYHYGKALSRPRLPL